MSLLLDTAIKYAQKGLKVVPVAAGGKNPIIQDWVNNASDDVSVLEKWFGEEDNLNIGIVTGKASNIVVLDIDTKNGDGRKSVADFESKTGSYLPETVTAHTQNGGMHLFFKYPDGVTNIKGRVGILENVDIRADGNQVVVYPSVGVKGSYSWIRAPWDTKIAQLPKAWKQLVCGELDTTSALKICVTRHAFKLPESIPAGMRHSMLLSYACSLAAKKGISEHELAGAVREVNKQLCQPPITDERELNNIIAWAVERIDKPKEQKDEGAPPWLVSTDKGSIINDGLFVEWYKGRHELFCINSVFYDQEGHVPDDTIKNDIQEIIKPYVQTSVSRKVNNLLEALRNECFFEPPPLKHDIVYLRNTALKVDETGVYEVNAGFTVNRLSVDYNPEATCSLWNKFLHDLLYDEDVLTLQEFIGYCLIPTTVAQKALIIIGKGGEGKSIIGNVMNALFRTSMVQGELHKIQENRFMLAQLENKLLFYDDDLQSGALTDTGTFKKLVTATIPVLVERKGQQHYEILPYARVLACGNKSLEACYDHSDGFYRRLILLKCKELDENRIEDKLLANKIIDSELEGILNWALKGLQRLMIQNWEFTISKRSRIALQEAQEDGNSVIPFLRDESVVSFGEDEEVTSSDLYDSYVRWCELNALKPLAMRTVSNYIKENAEKLGIIYSNKVQGLRGYKGIGLRRKVEKAGRFTIVRREEA